MKTSNPEVKGLIFNILSFTDDVTVEGHPKPLDHYRKDFYRVINENKNLLRNSILNMAINSKIEVGNPNSGQALWIKVGDTLPEGMKLTGEGKFTTEEIEFVNPDLFKKALKHYYELRQELPLVNVSALDEFEFLLQ